MFIQFALGAALMLITIAVTGLGFWLLELWLVRTRQWLLRPPHRPKLLVVLGVLALWIMALLSLSIWLWALTFHALELFDGLEPAMHFSLLAFTTLGFGEEWLPVEWRLLGGLAAANGLMLFGLMTAVIVEAFRQIRLGQLAAQESAE
jgi:hypothetical protein